MWWSSCSVYCDLPDVWGYEGESGPFFVLPGMCVLGGGGDWVLFCVMLCLRLWIRVVGK